MSAYTIRTDGTESVGPEGIYLVWGYRWSGFEVETCEDLDDALGTFWGMYDRDDPKCIEGPAGVVPAADVKAWIEAADQRYEESRKTTAARLVGQTRFEVQLREPESNRAVEYDQFDDLSDAIALIGELARPGRCRVVLKIFTEAHGWVTERVVIDWDTTELEQAA